MLDISEQIGAPEVSCARPTGEWIRPDSHHSNPQLWVNSQCRAAAMLISGAGERVNLPWPTVALELRVEGNLSLLRGNQLDVQSSYGVLHWTKVFLVQRVLILMRDSLGT